MSDAIAVLLIDGNHPDREYYTQRLQESSLDYDVVQAATGQSGLDLYARQPIDCVILEIDLPDMSALRCWQGWFHVSVIPRSPSSS